MTEGPSGRQAASLAPESSAVGPDVGRLQRALARAYGRRGSRSLLGAAIGIAAASIGVTVLVTVGWVARYLDAPVAQASRWVAIAEALALAGLLFGLFVCRRVLRIISAWSRVRTREQASETWSTVESFSRVLLLSAAPPCFLAEVAVMPAFVTTDIHAPAYVAILVAIATLADALFMPTSVRSLTPGRLVGSAGSSGREHGVGRAATDPRYSWCRPCVASCFRPWSPPLRSR